MAVHLPVSFETLVELVEQLPSDQQQELVRRLQHRAKSEQLTADDKTSLLQAAQFDADVKAVPSPRREDWYYDDGR